LVRGQRRAAIPRQRELIELRRAAKLLEALDSEAPFIRRSERSIVVYVVAA
jgi:hypothetical protein